MPSSIDPPPSGPPPIKQRRSQRTYDALVETGLKLLEDHDFDSLPVAEIAKAAGYSVGAFYARFNNKEELLRAMVERYTADRIAQFEKLFAATSDADLIERYFEQQIARLWTNRYFWRASLYRSFQDPTFWEPFRRIVRRVGDRFVERAAQGVGRPLTDEEETSIRFAIQMTNGAINNTLINRPGPISVEDPDFRPRLVRAFRAISGWDALA
jgi:AcrR family transcriptional regulator